MENYTALMSRRDVNDKGDTLRIRFGDWNISVAFEQGEDPGLVAEKFRRVSEMILKRKNENSNT